MGFPACGSQASIATLLFDPSMSALRASRFAFRNHSGSKQLGSSSNAPALEKPVPEEGAAMASSVRYNAEFVAALLAAAKEAVVKNLGEGAVQQKKNKMLDLLERMGPSKVSALLKDDSVRAKAFSKSGVSMMKA
eukprot:3664677-Pyramimonas_sp.AAC.1